MIKKHEKLFKTRLTRPIRISIMLTLISSFFVISPLLITYASGYRYDFKNKKIIQTGLLNIDISPRNSEVYINGELIFQSLPFNISLFPDTYLLTIKKEGYKTWEKNISVISKQTTYINYFELLQDNLPTPANLSNIQNILGTEKSDNVLLITQAENDRHNLIYFNLKNNTTTTLLNNIDINSYSISPFHEFVYLIIEENNQKEIFLYNLNKNQQSTITFPQEEKIQWQDNKSTPLILEDTNQLFSVSENGEKKIITDFVSTTNWYIDKNQDIWVYNNNLLTNNKETYNLQENITNIIDINQQRIIAKGNNGYFVYNTETEKTNNINGETILFNSDKKSWIIYSEWEITELQENGTINLQYRSGEKIKNLQILNEGSLYVVSTENSMRVLDVDKYLQIPLLEQKNQIFYLNKKYKKIFYASTEGNLYFLDL